MRTAAMAALRQQFVDWPQVWSTFVALTPPTDDQLALLAPVVELHRRNGLVIDDLPWKSPREVCPDGATCWAGCPKSSYEYHSSAPLPYVGPGYGPGGVGVVGINPNDASGLLVEYDITELDVAALRGGRTAGASAHSKFAYYTARSAHALITGRASGHATDERDPPALVDAVLATARFQSVKCSPVNPEHSKPTPAMDSNCPERFLRHELELLKPGALLAFGRPVRWALERIGAQITNEDADLGVGTLACSWGTADVYCLRHPAARRAPHVWQASQDQLIALLNRPFLA